MEFWIPVAVSLYCAGFYYGIHTRHSTVEKIPRILIWGGCAGLALTWHLRQIHEVVLTGSGDSFHSLGILQQSGLVALSLALIGFSLWLSDCKTRYLCSLLPHKRVFIATGLVVDFALSILLFQLLLTISPQVFYFYYQLVFPGLPAQWVITASIEINTIGKFLSMTSVDRYSELLSALALWTLIFIVIWRWTMDLDLQSNGKNMALISGGMGLGCFVWSQIFA